MAPAGLSLAFTRLNHVKSCSALLRNRVAEFVHQMKTMIPLRYTSDNSDVRHGSRLNRSCIRPGHPWDQVEDEQFGVDLSGSEAHFLTDRSIANVDG
jgi:hypothetical protein